MLDYYFYYKPKKCFVLKMGPMFIPKNVNQTKVNVALQKKLATEKGKNKDSKAAPASCCSQELHEGTFVTINSLLTLLTVTVDISRS